MGIRPLLAVFLLWEAYWAYLFFTAPRPDEGMQSAAAIMFGVVLPLIVATPIALIVIFRRLLRNHRAP